jgi:hypothetical protein
VSVSLSNLRRVLIRDQDDRDAVSSQLLGYRDGHGDEWADIIDMLTMYPEARRRVARLLGEIEADEQREGGRVRRATGEGDSPVSRPSTRRPVPI